MRGNILKAFGILAFSLFSQSHSIAEQSGRPDSDVLIYDPLID